MSSPFSYPAAPHVRRHAPRGYANHSEFRAWLRDDFAFRCVYCLLREVWVPGGFHLDHFVPVSLRPDLATEYDNLLYACGPCNLGKQDARLPDPTASLLEESVEVQESGLLLAKTKPAKRIIARLALNRPSYCRFRRLWISVFQMARDDNPELLRQVLGFPTDLPDLSKLRPPGGNAKPDGVEQSYFRLRERGELPETY